MHNIHQSAQHAIECKLVLPACATNLMYSSYYLQWHDFRKFIWNFKEDQWDYTMDCTQIGNSFFYHHSPTPPQLKLGQVKWLDHHPPSQTFWAGSWFSVGNLILTKLEEISRKKLGFSPPGWCNFSPTVETFSAQPNQLNSKEYWHNSLK